MYKRNRGGGLSKGVGKGSQGYGKVELNVAQP